MIIIEPEQGKMTVRKVAVTINGHTEEFPVGAKYSSEEKIQEAILGCIRKMEPSPLDPVLSLLEHYRKEVQQCTQRSNPVEISLKESGVVVLSQTSGADRWDWITEDGKSWQCTYHRHGVPHGVSTGGTVEDAARIFFVE